QLEEEVEDRGRRRERRQQLLEAAVIEDVVRSHEARDPVAPGHLAKLRNDARRGLSSKRHPFVVQPAERAVVLLTPPAASRGLERKAVNGCEHESLVSQVLTKL